jgi:NAD(P)H-hydrate epimerase
VQPVLTVGEMQAVDARAHETTELGVLVARAGRAVAGSALALLGGAYGRRVVVVAGRGNNGADGRVAAGLLRDRGARVTVVDAGSVDRIGPCELVIDAAYGTGFRGEYRAPGLRPGTPVLAVDIPSGVAGDSGVAAGAPWAARATVTFVARKPGLLQADGIVLAGDVVVADIGLPVPEPTVRLAEDADLARMLPPRRRETHKWSSAVLVVAGSPGMTGAAALAARAAGRAGAGMVRLGIPGADPADAPASEAVSVPLPHHGWAGPALEAAARCRAVVVGPGLGREAGTSVEVRRLVAESPVPVVVDADGLFALGRIDRDPVRPRSELVLTPHDGEYELLVGERPGPDRIAAARRLAGTGRLTGLVKGSTTAVAGPGGRVVLATAGSPRLATAGTGDVLSGIIGACLARGVPALRGRVEGLLAGDLPELVADVLSDARTAGAGALRG